jgi:hypothetical protein
MKTNYNTSQAYFQKFLLMMLVGLIAIKTAPAQNPAMAEKVKAEFIRAWDDYKTYAWPHDMLKPVSRSYSDWYEHSLHISPIDAYSTMKVMHLEEQAAEVEKYVKEEVDFDKDIFVKTFEVNIRILGGLLSMFDFTGDTALLAKAIDFGNRMLPAFESPTGIPYYWVNLKTGAVKGDEVNVAEAGSYLIEMGMLSHYTGNPIYYQKAKSASKAIFSRRSSIGLIGERINIVSGEWTDERSHIGCCIDSYYEYLYKGWLLFGDKQLREMWITNLDAIDKYLTERVNGRLWYGQANMNTGEMMNRIVTLYDAYFPAVLVLSQKVNQAADFQDSWFWLWNQNGLEPMVYDYGIDSITNPSYDLNPEIAESAYYLYYYTRDEKYMQMNVTIFEDLLKYCKYDVAYTSIANVKTKERADELPTFFFAETLKYLYLTFSGEYDNFLDEHVLNTEAHPFKKLNFAR